MKIAVVGVHGSGKSTKVFQLAEKYKKIFRNKTIHIIQENVINCPFEFNEKTTYESQMWIIADQIKAELEAQKKYDFIICDRSVFDPIAYSYVCGLPDVSNILYEFLKHYGNTYDKIYLMNGSKNNYIFEDGLRTTNEEFRKKVDLKFFDIFSKLQKENYIKDLKII